MMYQKKFAVALKSANGQVLREFNNDKVLIPFGSEYSVFLKNMHDRRAVAQISIDGQDVGDGVTFVVPAYNHLTIERFVKNGNLNAGNRFKFIERTGAVASHRGVDIEDGLIRVTFQLEKERPRVCSRGIHDQSYSFDDGVRGIACSTSFGRIAKSFGSNNVSGNTGDYTSGISSSIQNDVGVTAPGSISDQSFRLAEDFPVEAEKTVFVLQILGETEDNRYVHEPVTVKTKPRCSQCGAWNNYNAKFCSECGAGLQIV